MYTSCPRCARVVFIDVRPPWFYYCYANLRSLSMSRLNDCYTIESSVSLDLKTVN